MKARTLGMLVVVGLLVPAVAVVAADPAGWVAVRVDTTRGPVTARASASFALCGNVDPCAAVAASYDPTGMGWAMAWGNAGSVYADASTVGGLHAGTPHSPSLVLNGGAGVGSGGTVDGSSGPWAVFMAFVRASVGSARLEMDPPDRVLAMASGPMSDVRILRAGEFEALGHASVGLASAGAGYEKVIATERGLMGVFNTAAFVLPGLVPGIAGVESAAEGPDGPYPCDEWGAVIQGEPVKGCFAHGVSGGPGTYRFTVPIRAGPQLNQPMLYWVEHPGV